MWCRQEWDRHHVFILQSIKPRVETLSGQDGAGWRSASLSYNPSNQGLKLFLMLVLVLSLMGLYPTIHQTKGWNAIPQSEDNAEGKVFILQSIKPRVETSEIQVGWEVCFPSLSYNPSNQGLKPTLTKDGAYPDYSLYPTIHQTKGWNRRSSCVWWTTAEVFILQSIKPRVETVKLLSTSGEECLSLSYNPSNQGLKLYQGHRLHRKEDVFILQSIKPRVETSWQYRRWKQQILSLSYNPSNQGLKLPSNAA